MEQSRYIKYTHKGTTTLPKKHGLIEFKEFCKIVSKLDVCEEKLKKMNDVDFYFTIIETSPIDEAIKYVNENLRTSGLHTILIEWLNNLQASAEIEEKESQIPHYNYPKPTLPTKHGLVEFKEFCEIFRESDSCEVKLKNMNNVGSHFAMIEKLPFDEAIKYVNKNMLTSGLTTILTDWLNGLKASAEIKGTKPQITKMQQDCAECTIIKAAEIFNLPINFENAYKNYQIKDEQIDLSPAFVQSPNNDKIASYVGNDKQKTLLLLNNLKSYPQYFIRTGKNNQVGHWQLLILDNNKDWINYSSDTNNYQLTQGNDLTIMGENILAQNGFWGQEGNQYMYLFVKATNENVIRAANFLYNYRMKGEVQAIELAWGINDKLLKELNPNF